MERQKDFCGFVLQKELTVGRERCLAAMLQITAGVRTLGWTWKMNIAGLLEPITRPKGNSPNYRQLIKEKKNGYHVVLFKGHWLSMVTPNTSRLHQCTVLKTLSQAINEILGPKYLYFQRNIEHVREIVSKFEVKFGIP